MSPQLNYLLYYNSKDLFLFLFRCYFTIKIVKTIIHFISSDDPASFIMEQNEMGKQQQQQQQQKCDYVKSCFSKDKKKVQLIVNGSDHL